MADQRQHKTPWLPATVKVEGKRVRCYWRRVSPVAKGAHPGQRRTRAKDSGFRDGKT
jgi:hypothetical protein